VSFFPFRRSLAIVGDRNEGELRFEKREKEEKNDPRCDSVVSHVAVKARSLDVNGTVGQTGPPA